MANTILYRTKIFLLVAILAFSSTTNSFAQTAAGLSSLEKSMDDQGMVNVGKMDPSLVIDLKYATTDNFTKTVLYDSMTIAYLHPVAAKKLVKAHEILKKGYPNYRFILYDVARPLSVQKKMYKVVQNTPYAAYVANPSRTGLHNYGMAVDLSICTKDGVAIDMGTAFDFFGSAAGINKEEELVTRGVLTRQQVNNRKLLRRVMVEAGFFTIRGEWWHFNAVSLSTARSSYKVMQ